MDRRPDDRESSPPPPSAAVPDFDLDDLLRDGATLWETIWRTTGEYVAIVDREGIIRACNRVDDGFTVDQVVGHSLVRFTVPTSAAALADTLRHVLDDGQMRTLETMVRRLDGGLNYFALRIAPIRRAGCTVAALVCCENIRPLKNTEQALTHERNVLRRLLDIQEQERQLVSYDIHDGLSQYIAGALMHFEAYAHRQGSRAAAKEFADGMQLLQAAAAESRRLIGGLRPPALDELGIVAAIETLLAEIRGSIPHVAFRHSLSGGRLPSQLETGIFRIVQEALCNARKHAAADSVEVTLEQIDDHVRICVRDDGRGFDITAVPEERFGLDGIRRRCQLLGGEPRIASAAGAGTTIEATLPIPSVE